MWWTALFFLVFRFVFIVFVCWNSYGQFSIEWSTKQSIKKKTRWNLCVARMPVFNKLFVSHEDIHTHTHTRRLIPIKLWTTINTINTIANSKECETTYVLTQFLLLLLFIVVVWQILYTYLYWQQQQQWQKQQQHRRQERNKDWLIHLWHASTRFVVFSVYFCFFIL